MPEKPLLKQIQRPILKQTPIEIENKSVFEKNNFAENTPLPKKSVTANLGVKPTSPTLMEFQSKEAVIPEWRLELKNAVQRKLRENQQTPGERELFPTPRVINRTVGATALKPEYVEEIEEPVLHENPTVQNALLRIQESRQKFLAVEENISETIVEEQPKKDFPYYIASRSVEITAPRTEQKSPVYTVTKPKLVASLPVEGFKRDTNKLPPLPKPAVVSTSFDRTVETKTIEEIEPLKDEVFEKTAFSEIKISPQKTDESFEEEEILTDENEDLAPFAMRFNAGLFDLIIGGFSSLILLAPFILLGGEWFTTAGLLAFLATCSIVMFIYLTTAVGMFGKTFGMKMFSLEIIDIEENDYPTFHQAAVSAAVYLLSLALGGSGFLTVLFTDEKRAVHDIVSGTLMVRDFHEENA